MGIIDYINDDSKWIEFNENFQNSVFKSSFDKRKLNKFVEDKKYKKIYELIENGVFFKGYPNKIKIPKGNGKNRIVYCYYSDYKIVLKFIASHLSKYDSLFNDNLYSFRKTINGHNALSRLKYIIRDKKMDLYGYKMDLSSYFNSINKDLLIHKIKENIKDDDKLVKFFINILNVNHFKIRSRKGNKYFDGDLIEDNQAGAMPGVPISSFFANLFLKDLDKYFYDNKIYYFRYADDILVLGKAKEEVEKYKNYIYEYIRKSGLDINEKKTKLYSPNDTIEFLGLDFNKEYINPSNDTINKSKSFIKKYTRQYKYNITKHKWSSEKAIKRFIEVINNKYFGSEEKHQLSWKYWYFSIIDNTSKLKLLDLFIQEHIRYLISLSYSKKNYKLLPYSKLKEYGYKSLVNEYWDNKEQRKTI